MLTSAQVLHYDIDDGNANGAIYRTSHQNEVHFFQEVERALQRYWNKLNKALDKFWFVIPGESNFEGNAACDDWNQQKAPDSRRVAGLPECP